MKLRILGCSGGIGGNARTTSMLLNGDVLIDAGTGVGDLGLAELSRIEHVFVTHAHLDHIACIPLLVDSVGFNRKSPLTVHATAQTLAALEKHVFNWEIWPDFTQIPEPGRPLMRYSEIAVGKTVEASGVKITVLPANHAVPAVGFYIEGARGGLVFSGDTTTCDALWDAVNRIPDLATLIVETAFCNADREIAALSRHYCPMLLAKDLKKLKSQPKIYITHLKPGEADLIMREIGECVTDRAPAMLQNGQVFEI